MKKIKIITSIVVTSLLATSIVLAATLPLATSGTPLTKTIWDNMINQVNENTGKINGISNVGGNIGIGTNNPERKLHVEGLIGDIKISSNSNPQAFIMMEGTSGTKGYFGTSKNGGLIDGINDGDVVLRSEFAPLHLSAGGGKMTIISGGNVGIGTSTPTNKLEVNGTIGYTNTQNGVINSYAGMTINIDSDNNVTNERFDIAHGKNKADLNNRIASFYENGEVEIPKLSGTGNAYACLDSYGKLFRSISPCN